VLKFRTPLVPFSGAYGHFLLGTPRSPGGSSILAASARRMVTIRSPDPDDRFGEIGRYWLRGQTDIGTSGADVYLNWRTGERRVYPWTSPYYASPHDINSPDLAQAPPDGEPYGLFERDGRFELRMPYSNFDTVYLRDLVTGRERPINVGDNVSFVFAAERLTWFESRSRFPGPVWTYTIHAFDALTGHRKRWVVRGDQPLLYGTGVSAQAVGDRIFVDVVADAIWNDKVPVATGWRIYSARWPR
jgi:hypothetical protein